MDYKIPIKLESFYNPSYVEKDLEFIYVFGDNCTRFGKKGQACIRGLRNAHGVRTKKFPRMHESSFFTDNDEKDKNCIIDDLNQLKALALKSGKGVAFPISGLGTGLSQMPVRCPELFKFMNDEIERLFNVVFDYDKQRFFIKNQLS